VVFVIIKSEWYEGTPIEKPSIIRTIDYTKIELPKETSLLARDFTKVIELLWSTTVKIDPIIGTQGHVIVKIINEDSEEIAHVFSKDEISKINTLNPDEFYKVVIKTRNPMDPRVYFHEIRYIEI